MMLFMGIRLRRSPYLLTHPSGCVKTTTKRKGVGQTVNNQLYALVCLTLIIMTTILLVASRRERRHRHRRGKYTALYMALLLWQIAELGFFTIKDPLWSKTLFDARQAMMTFLVLLLFFILMEFYRLEPYFPAWLGPALSVVPCITALLSLTSSGHGFMTEHFDILTFEPLTIVRFYRGPWFYIHSVYSLLLIAAMVSIMVIRYQSLPKAYRGGTGPLALGIAAMVVGVIAEVSRPLKNTIDPVLIAATLAGLLFYVAIVRNGRSDYLQIERREIFNYLDPAVFVLSLDGWVLDINRPARHFLDVLGENCDGVHFDTFFEKLYTSGKIVAKRVEGQLEGDTHFVTAKYPVIYLMRRQTLRDGAGGTAGWVVTLEDVTRNRLFIERLQSMAGIDGLTGLQNRYGYQALLRRMDIAENLPLCVIMGDVNGLKRVNDNYGHAEGDRFLIAVADAIRSCLIQGGHAARVGGDEFVIVSPNCTEEEGQAVIAAINARLSQVTHLPERPSIALGLAVKTELSQNINSLITSADTKMYKTKGSSRAG